MGTVNNFSGTLQYCGAAYSQKFQREIAGFFSQEFGVYNYSRSFVLACLKRLQQEAPNTATFLKGVASKSLLSLAEHTLLLLHEEELYHRKLLNKKPHCSAVGVVYPTGKMGTLLGQNWDWNTAYFPWISFNRFKIRNKPRLLTLSFPGMPICAGVNSSGLSLMWTGAGYYPALRPTVGVPTYALIFEILLLNGVEAALDYLTSIKNAGAFIFILGDAQGSLAVVEAVPGKVFIKRIDAIHRANIFELPEAIAASSQKLPKLKKCHSLKRNKVFCKTFPDFALRPSLTGIKAMLSQKDIFVNNSCLHASLVQMVADCKKKKLLFSFWRQRSKAWIEFNV